MKKMNAVFVLALGLGMLLAGQPAHANFANTGGHDVVCLDPVSNELKLNEAVWGEVVYLACPDRSPKDLRYDDPSMYDDYAPKDEIITINDPVFYTEPVVEDEIITINDPIDSWQSWFSWLGW